MEQVQRLRELELRKAPSIGETLDWAQALVALGSTSLSPELVEETLSVVVKYDRDATKVLQAIGRNGGRTHGHSHHHHHHDHEHAHDHEH